jgi:carboxylesterase
MTPLAPQPPHPLDAMPDRQATDFLLSRNSRSLIYLIHGATGTPVEMRYLALGLARAQWDVYVTTLPGHCGSLRDLVRGTESDWRNHVYTQLAFAKTRYEAVFVAGLSAGGLLGLDASVVMPLAGVGVLSPTFFYDGWNTPWHDFLLPLSMKFIPYRWQHLFFHVDGSPFGIKDDVLQDQVRAAYHPMAIFREWRDLWWPKRASTVSQDDPSSASKGHPVFPLKTLTEIDRLINRVRKSLPHVTAPTVILQAVEDDMTSPRNAQLVFDSICSTNKELILLDDCYHVITVDLQKKAVSNYLSDFFRKASAVSAFDDGERPPRYSSS